MSEDTVVIENKNQHPILINLSEYDGRETAAKRKNIVKLEGGEVNPDNEEFEPGYTRIKKKHFKELLHVPAFKKRWEDRQLSKVPESQAPRHV